jgi:hypothetical protein
MCIAGAPELTPLLCCPPAAVLSGVPIVDVGQVNVTPDGCSTR